MRTRPTGSCSPAATLRRSTISARQLSHRQADTQRRYTSTAGRSRELPPVLQVYEGCARVLSGTVDQANMIKLSVTQPQVSYLSYPSFDRDAHPTLAAAVTVNLRKLTVDWRDYSHSENPPLLHRKEEFLGKDDPRRPLYEKLTRAEIRAGLYEHPERIGNLQGWQRVLTQSGATIRGHRITRSC